MVRLGKPEQPAYRHRPGPTRRQAASQQVLDHELRPTLAPFGQPLETEFVAACRQRIEGFACLLGRERLLHVATP
jgi:hypothetical protein